MNPKHALLALICSSATISAASISINFSENSTNQGFTGGSNIGPLSVDSSNWNTTNGQASLAAGTLNNLKDDSGTVTTTSMTWSSSGPFYNTEDGTGSDERRLSVGYLDDGGGGISVSMSNIPYANYRVIGLYSSDAANGAATVQAQDMNVNGTWVFGGATSQSVTATGSIPDNQIQNGANWSILSPTDVGNYWSFDTSGSTLTITQSPAADAGRAALAGVIIEEIPEPSSTALLGLAGLTLILRRRK